MNKFDKAYDRIKHGVMPDDSWTEDDVEHYLTVCEALETCSTLQKMGESPESLRPKGRWELHGNDDDCGCSYFCSNCHRSYPEEWFWDHGRYVPFENCPHCTAKMEG